MFNYELYKFSGIRNILSNFSQMTVIPRHFNVWQEKFMTIYTYHITAWC